MYIEVNKTWPCKIYSLGEKVGHMIREMGKASGSGTGSHPVSTTSWTQVM